MFEKLGLQGEKSREPSWVREAFQRRRRSFFGCLATGGMGPRGDYEHALRSMFRALSEKKQETTPMNDAADEKLFNLHKGKG